MKIPAEISRIVAFTLRNNRRFPVRDIYFGNHFMNTSGLVCLNKNLVAGRIVTIIIGYFPVSFGDLLFQFAVSIIPVKMAMTVSFAGPKKRIVFKKFHRDIIRIYPSFVGFGEEFCDRSGFGIYFQNIRSILNSL